MTGLLESIFERRGGALPLTDAEPWYEAGILNRSAAGVNVNPEMALGLTAVYAAVRILAESVASLPCITYERGPDGEKKRAQKHNLYNILKQAPNPDMTAFDFWSALTANRALWGNAYAEIQFDGRGQITSLFPLLSARMESVVTDPEHGIIYKYRLPASQGNRLIGVPAERIFHLRGLSWDGLRGWFVTSLAKNAIGLASATEEYGSSLFLNGAVPKVVLMHPQELGEKARKNLTESWELRHAGLSNANRVAILQEGMTIKTIGMPPEDVQFLGTRKFQLSEIARIFRIPPHMLADLEKATFSNIEHQGIGFVTHTMRPWLVSYEQEITRSLFLPRERGRWFTEFLVDGLLRGDLASRYAAYQVGRMGGWLSQNDIRKKENMNPIKGGDVYLTPLNMEPSNRDWPLAGISGALEMVSGPDAANLSPGQTPQHTRTPSKQTRSAHSRHRLANSQRAPFEDIAARILRRERQDVGAQVDKLLKSGDIEKFEDFLTKFYAEHRQFATDQMLPAMRAYADAVASQIESEIGEDTDLDALAEFVEAYALQYGIRHSDRSLVWLRERLAALIAEDEETEKIAEVLGEMLQAWLDERAARIAREEATREGNAVSKEMYRNGGILFLVSVSIGDSCPYCNALDGVRVGIDENFLEAGEDFQPDGADRPLNVTRSAGHAPYHGGCDCMIVAST